MGNVERCDKTLPLNEMIFHVRRDATLRARWLSDLAGLARQFGLSREELEALQDKDVRRLNEMGVHQYYIPQILRLFYGASANSNAHPALEAYRRAYPEEAAASDRLQERLARGQGGAMAQGVAAMAMTHSPGLTGWFDRAPEDQRRQARRALGEMRDRLRAARPDVIVLVSNDHLLNWPINNTPEYTVGIGAEHVGPADWYDEWLALEKYRIPGHPALARYLVNEGARRRLALAYLRDMQFDDGVSVPMHYLNPEGDIALVPVTMNCTVPPIPTPQRAYEVGTTLREMVHAYPGALRVAVLATGGLSHEPGGPRYFWVDEEFDRWFLDLLGKGDHETLVRECTLERMEAAGSGGTAELLAWIVALAFTTGPAEVLAYMPAIAWRSGTGMVVWPDVRN